jgi:hypothetical protein
MIHDAESDDENRRSIVLHELEMEKVRSQGRIDCSKTKKRRGDRGTDLVNVGPPSLWAG